MKILIKFLLTQVLHSGLRSGYNRSQEASSRKETTNRLHFIFDLILWNPSSPSIQALCQYTVFMIESLPTFYTALSAFISQMQHFIL